MPSAPSLKTSGLRRARQRGVTLLEGMIASVVLLLGLVGVMQGIIHATRQNANATKIIRAGAIASRIRAALMTQGPATFEATGKALENSNCTTSTLAANVTNEVLETGLTAGLYSGYTSCAVDLWGNPTSFEAAALTPNKLGAGLETVPDADLFKVVLVRYRNAANKTVGVNIVVSWNEGVNLRKRHSQYVAFYDTSIFPGASL